MAMKEWKMEGKLQEGTEWWLNDRDDVYKTRQSDGSTYWFLNGQPHRIDGPAIEKANGGKEWWLNGKLHRTDGPAIMRANGAKEWWVDEYMYKIDQPSETGETWYDTIEHCNGDKEWWIHGVQMTEEDYNEVYGELVKSAM